MKTKSQKGTRKEKGTYMRYISLMVMLTICLGAFNACANVDYGYEFYYSIVDGNGSISPEWGGETSPIIIRGSKKGQQLKFIATPNNGYQVKEWTCNGKVVEGNKSNSFTAIAIDYKHNKVTITVEFEMIPEQVVN